MSEYTVIRDYPYPVAEVWHVLTDPEQVAQWTTTGQGGRPEGFAPVPGTRFRFVGKPTMGWSGVVHCEVISVTAPHAMRYTWKGDQDSDDVTEVTYLLEPLPHGTRLTWRHTGFTGVGGFAMSRLLGSVRKRMLADGLPAALEAYHAREVA
ncbi:SRPBCC domain-containing protein [Actinoplanes sp. KI2]|uniref:SRPBCC family protein n=1 Tax=Actinoplanes sp. KI2 TaxID=2983315 RepID=UPI0021D57EE9|nr:SRPBCC domain-containing protein [Actinoplanes sp. KI2]MCU7722857.1 SRPBCC domain-containing protein [Actinoplanes sp. KI2]